jgi:competence protein ComEC
VRALLLLAVGYGLGGTALPWHVAAGLSVASAAAVVVRRWRGLALCALFVAVGWLRWEAASYMPARALPDGAWAQLDGVVLEREEVERAAVDLRVRGWLRTANSSAAPVHAVFLARCPAGLDPAIRYGTRVRVEGTLRQPTPARNPHGFDAAAYLARRDVEAMIQVRRPTAVAALGQGGLAGVRVLHRLRARLVSLFDTYLPAPDNALLAGLLFGARRDIPDDVAEQFRDGGVSHVLVVSGANFALLAGVVFVGLRVVRLPFRAVYLGTLLVSGLFAALVGFQPPVVRAGLLIALYLVARLLERDADLPNLLALSALLILLWRPPALHDIGFQLSFGATAGLVYFVPRWNFALDQRTALRRRMGEGPALYRAMFHAVHWCVQTLLATAAATLVVAPIVAYHFQKFYWAGFLANIPVLALVGAISVGGLIAAVAGLVWMPAGEFFAGGLWVGFRALLPVVRFFADLPYAVVPVSRPNVAELALYVLIVLALTHIGWLRDRPARSVLVGVGAAACVAWSGALQPLSSLLQVTFLDVGQGDATFLRMPDGRALLVDAGSASGGFDNGERVVVPHAVAERAARLDWVLQTHPDNDHAGGIPAVVRALPVGEVLGVPREPLSAPSDARLRRALRERRVRADFGFGRVLHATTVGGRPLRVEVLHPRFPKDADLEDANTNNDSLVTAVEYGDVRILLPGDIEEEAERELVARHRAGALRLHADVLLVPHHGSESSSTAAFVDAVGPRLAVISVGRRNPYGLPSGEVVRRYAAAGARVLRTDRHGAVTVWSDGRRCWVRTALDR